MTSPFLTEPAPGPVAAARPAASLKRMAVVPLFAAEEKNFLFAPPWEDYWTEPHILLQREARRRGYDLATHDLCAGGEVQLVLFKDLPEQRARVAEIRRRWPAARFILLAYESPIVAPHAFDPANHHAFDLVLTYHPGLAARGGKYRRLFLPVGAPPAGIPDRPWQERQPMVLVNSNKYHGLLDAPRPWKWWSTLRQPAAGGWRLGLRDMVRSLRGNLYPARRRLARRAEREFAGSLHVYGAGWKGLATGYWRRLFPDRPYGCEQPWHPFEKLVMMSGYRFVIAYENYRGREGYISEKIFHPLYAGAVPVYLGEETILEHVPAEVFVDARRFGSERELLAHLVQMPEAEWQRRRQAGREFVTSGAMKPFRSEHYVETLLAACDEVLAAPRRAREPV